MSGHALGIFDALKGLKAALIFNPNSSTDYDWHTAALIAGVVLTAVCLKGFHQDLSFAKTEIRMGIKWFRWLLSSKAIGIASIRKIGEDRGAAKPRWFLVVEGSSERIWLPAAGESEASQLRALRDALRGTAV